MIAIAELELLTLARLEDAHALLAAGRFDGAAYVGGYCAELALKARICHTLHWAGYPATASEFQGYASLRTHNLDVLLRFSGLEPVVLRQYFSDWAVVQKWNPEQRYRVVGSTLAASATEFLVAIANLIAVL